MQQSRICGHQSPVAVGHQYDLPSRVEVGPHDTSDDLDVVVVRLPPDGVRLARGDKGDDLIILLLRRGTKENAP